MAYPTCPRCGERFDTQNLLISHVYTINGRKRMHRFVMPYEKHTYHCLTADEMASLGWRKSYRVWRSA